MPPRASRACIRSGDRSLALTLQFDLCHLPVLLSPDSFSHELAVIQAENELRHNFSERKGEYALVYNSAMGRPSLYKPETVEAICARLSEGEPLAQICRDEQMPSYSAVWDWMNVHPSVKEAIARAREHGEDVIAADCLKIADDGSNDTYVDENGFRRTDHDVVTRSRLRVDTRLKLLAKWNPKKWADRQAHEHSGPEGKPLEIRVTGIIAPEAEE